MNFASPFALIFLLALPIIWYVGYPRYAFRRRRDILALSLRTIIVLCLVLGIAGMQIVRPVERLAVVFLVDISDSMGNASQEAAIEYIERALETKPVDDEWSIVVFGETPLPESGFTDLVDVPAIQSTLDAGNTDIASAIQMAISLFPADARRRIVILSDGQETLGNAEVKAQLAAASGIEISYVPVYREPVPDVRVEALESPPRVAEGQQFDLNVTLVSSETTPATLRIFSGDRLIHEAPITLQPGETGYTLTQTASESGFLNFRAEIAVSGTTDVIKQNNELAAFSQIVGPPRVLLIRSSDQDIQQLLPALENTGMQVDVREPAGLPQDTARLVDYDSIIIVNVPASQFSNRQMERLQTYVRDLGGGLVFVGGPESYGPGGYYQTAIEETLPVEMRIRDQERLPQLTIAYLIDRSGSMGVVSNGIPNIELAKQAINISLDLLESSDRAAIGTFDTGGSWVAEFQNINDRRFLQQLVGTLRAGGGTDILAGLRLVERDIVNEPSERKHLILLTDGGANPNDIVELTQTLNEEHGVTTSVVAIGATQPDFLEEMTVVGDGNYHEVRDISQIPNIFAQETVLATRSYIEEGLFEPVRTARSPILDGIGGLPALRGYVATTEKDTATVVLRGPEPLSDPLLATWQYGLGRAVAFTGDASGRWASNWLATDVFPRFWNQAVNWTITDSAENNIETRIIMLDDRAQILVDARDDSGAFLNNLNLEASLLNPDDASQRVFLNQVAPGRYEATFEPDQDGAYFVSINGDGIINDEAISFNEINGWVMSYSPEYIEVEPDETLLRRLANITGGTNLSDTPTGVFEHNLEERRAAAPVWQWLLLLAILLLPLDIAVRRLIVTRSDLQRLRRYLFGRDAQERSERMSSLVQARNRARDRTAYGDTPDTASSTISTLRQRRSTRQSDEPEADTPPAPRQPRPTEPDNDAPKPAPSPRPGSNDGGTINDLLRRRKQDRDN